MARKSGAANKNVLGPEAGRIKINFRTGSIEEPNACRVTRTYGTYVDTWHCGDTVLIVVVTVGRTVIAPVLTVMPLRVLH